MNIYLKKLENYELKDFELMEVWDNDPDIKHFITPNREEGPIKEVYAEEMLKRAAEFKDKIIYFIKDGDKPIGCMSIVKNFELLTEKDEKTAWISIGIGEKDYWGKGISKTAMLLLEEECKKQGYDKIELGVFSFNNRAIGLYKSLGYKEISVNKEFTYYNGHWYDDIRMMKHLILA